MQVRLPSRCAAYQLVAAWTFAIVVPPCDRADETMRQVQEELRRLSLYFGDIDGCQTAQLAAALRSDQRGKGFSPTGEPDDTTLRSLNLLPARAARLGR